MPNYDVCEKCPPKYAECRNCSVHCPPITNDAEVRRLDASLSRAHRKWQRLLVETRAACVAFNAAQAAYSQALTLAAAQRAADDQGVTK